MCTLGQPAMVAPILLEKCCMQAVFWRWILHSPNKKILLQKQNCVAEKKYKSAHT